MFKTSSASFNTGFHTSVGQGMGPSFNSKTPVEQRTENAAQKLQGSQGLGSARALRGNCNSLCPHNGRGEISSTDIAEHVLDGDYGKAARDIAESRQMEAIIDIAKEVCREIGETTLRGDRDGSIRISVR